MAKSNRKFVRISKKDLAEKIAAINEDDSEIDADNGFSFDINALLYALNKDIKVRFDTENSDSDNGSHYGNLVGFHTLDNGFSFLGFAAGGDWEAPVFFLIYWDGKKLRGYVPTKGNVFNTDTMQAFGNDGKADAKNLIKRSLATKEDFSDNESDDGEAYSEDAPEFDWKEIEADIKERIVER